MKKIKYLIVISLFIFSCNKKQEKRNNFEQIEGDQSEVNVKDSFPLFCIELNDTIVNGIRLDFTLLNKKQFELYSQHIIKTEIPNDPFKEFVRKEDSLQLIYLKNGNIDTLKDYDIGDYFEKYLIQTFWKEKNQLLVEYSNWEENVDFFISTKNGSYYALETEWKLSPEKNLIFSFNNMARNPLYMNEVLLTEIETDSIKTIFKKDFVDKTIIYFNWIENRKGILTVAELIDSTWTLINKTNYLIEIK